MRQSGRKVTTWYFKTNDGIRAEVPVRMWDGTGKTTFFVDSPDYGLKMSNTSIDVLKKEVEEYLKQHGGVTWKEFIAVEFGGEIPKDLETTLDYKNATAVELRLKAGVLQIGTRSNGSKCYRRDNTRVQDGEYEEQAGDIDPWNRHAEILVPNTKTNVEAVLEFQTSLAQLTQKIYGHLVPGRSEKGLQRVNEQLKKLVKAFK